MLNTIDEAGRLAHLERPSSSAEAFFAYNAHSYLAYSSEEPLPPEFQALAAGSEIIFEDGVETWDLAAWTSCFNTPGCPNDELRSVSSTYSSDGPLMALEDDLGQKEFVLYFAGRPVAQLTWNAPPANDFD